MPRQLKRELRTKDRILEKLPRTQEIRKRKNDRNQESEYRIEILHRSNKGSRNEWRDWEKENFLQNF